MDKTKHDNLIGLNEIDQRQFRDDMSVIVEALRKKEYNPVSQITGYLISGDPTYITSNENARQLMLKYDRHDATELLLEHFLNS